MQTLVNHLQNIIKKHYGLSSQLELKKTPLLDNNQTYIYSAEEKTLSFPLIDPASRHSIALFKVSEVLQADPHFINRISDLVQVTLQSYIDLIEKMDTTENLIQYLQMELHPEKIIRLQKDDRKQEKKVHAGTIQLTPHDEDPIHTSPFRHHEILLLCKSRELSDSLAVHIHDASKNNFFIRTDHMPAHFLTRMNDLTGLEKTTLYIPHAHLLTSVQQKTLETYFLMQKSKSMSLVVLVGTQLPIKELIQQGISADLLKHLHLFHLMAGEMKNHNLRNFEALSQCASAVLGMQTAMSPTKSGEPHPLTKSYNLIPSFDKFTPTLH